ncbi:flagellar basal-body rod protein FlgB [Paenibacillus swuensis]|uniref:Flagellar basal body rod protein FlgB n=1 Tax=Paenibacillus swuensis TaxID=1178515 RepID=A0A172TKT9_9BACL|nr:flagellar basal body rod protein FlgB [Paenibacillus swuensis]ANE47534.1 flagellar basal-body rod protein FlgB [Paenibacillus swuensis]
MNIFNSVGVQSLERALDASMLRQKVITNNVANVDTPHFKRSEVKFEEYLQASEDALVPRPLTGSRTNPRHFQIGTAQSAPTPSVVTNGTTSMNNNQNNVDIDYEMTELAKNQLKYNTYVQQLNHEFAQLRIATDGRK